MHADCRVMHPSGVPGRVNVRQVSITPGATATSWNSITAQHLTSSRDDRRAVTTLDRHQRQMLAVSPLMVTERDDYYDVPRGTRRCLLHPRAGQRRVRRRHVLLRRGWGAAGAVGRESSRQARPHRPDGSWRDRAAVHSVTYWSIAAFIVSAIHSSICVGLAAGAR